MVLNGKGMPTMRIVIVLFAVLNAVLGQDEAREPSCHLNGPCLFNDLNITNSSQVDASWNETKDDYITDATSTTLDIESTHVDFSETTKTTQQTTTIVTPTDQTPSSTPASSLLFNKTNHLCVCDVIIGECDINCCCDTDCSAAQRKVFSHCEKLDIPYDFKYCYKSNFIYKNRTQHTIMRSDNGLFCIIKDNLKFSFNYKTTSVIASKEEFEKRLAKKKFFMYDSAQSDSQTFTPVPYHEGSLIWIFKEKSLTTFDLARPLIGGHCSLKHHVQYLRRCESECLYMIPQDKAGCEKIGQFHMKTFSDSLLLASPEFVNISLPVVSDKVCKNNSCIKITPYLCSAEHPSLTGCIANKTVNPIFKNKVCLNMVSRVNYVLYHNGSHGILQARAYFWLYNDSTVESLHLSQKISVDFRWIDVVHLDDAPLQRSGNPGYMTGKPILAGKKVYTVGNDTVKKEAIELSNDVREWLSAFGNIHGACAQRPRQPVLFREDAQYTCTKSIGKENFGKEACTALQQEIFEILTGEDFSKVMVNNQFNKHVGTYGNSNVDETADWVQIVFDLYPSIPTHTSYQSDSSQLRCRNIVTGLSINIVFSNIGSFSNPQAKIIGVLFHFGQPVNIDFRKNSTLVRQVKLYTFVNFVDVTEEAFDAFAEPPGFDARLPHDFFYPFFSNGSKNNLTLLLFPILIFTIFVHL